ncbi:MAG: hypothetical protein ABSH52_25330, partial [Terriglobia bacterium]
MSPEGAAYHSPGQRPGCWSVPSLSRRALKGRQSSAHLRIRLASGFITPLQGSKLWRRRRLTQAVGLG